MAREYFIHVTNRISGLELLDAINARFKYGDSDGKIDVEFHATIWTNGTCDIHSRDPLRDPLLSLVQMFCDGFSAAHEALENKPLDSTTGEKA